MLMDSSLADTPSATTTVQCVKLTHYERLRPSLTTLIGGPPPFVLFLPVSLAKVKAIPKEAPDDR